MIMTQRLIQCRVELKYLLWNHDVVRFLSSLGGALADPSFRRDHGRITTVYFDRDDGLLTRNVLASPERNLKLRLREYFSPAGISSSPLVWIEIKERDGITSRKSRFQLHKRLVRRFVEGTLRETDVLGCQGPRAERGRTVQAVRRARELADGSPLVPVGAVSYRRLALEGGEPGARLTLDQDVTYHRGPFDLYESVASLERDVLGPPAIQEPSAIVELKFRGTRPPGWCERGLAEARPVEYSKFQVLSAIALSEAGLD